MDRFAVFLVAFLALACGAPSTVIDLRDAKLVVHTEAYTSRVVWQRSPYARAGDMAWPWLVVYAPDGMACPVFHQVIREPVPYQDYWVCETSWRQPQH